jgi:probable HAF family extracellular repeat protein
MRRLSVLLIAILAASRLCGATEQIRVTDLDTLGGTWSGGLAVNASGKVVGCSETGIGLVHAFIWTRKEGLFDLGAQLPGDWSQANGVNDQGEVVGWWAYDIDDAHHAFLWSPTAGVTNLPTLGGDENEALGINNASKVVGWSLAANWEGHAFLWTQNGGSVDIQPTGGRRSVAYAINNSDQIAGGTVIPAGTYHAFLRSASGEVTDLGTLATTPDAWSEAVAVNDVGQVAGYSGDRHYALAFRWPPGGPMTSLGTLGGFDSRAHDINRYGVAVGFSFIAGGGTSTRRPFMAKPGSPMTDLGTLGGVAGHAYSINDLGQMVGYSQTAAGRWHACLWEIRPTADVNGDYCVNVIDLLQVRNMMGKTGSGILPPEADVNGDGMCNVIDLLLVRNGMGTGPACK